MSMPRSSLRSVILYRAPLPMTGKTRRVAPSSMTFARSSAIRTEVPAARAVSSSTTPRFTTPTSGGGAVVFGSAGRAMGKTRVQMIAAVRVHRFIGSFFPCLCRGRSPDVWRRPRRGR